MKSIDDNKMKRLLVTGASGFLGWNICSVAVETWAVYGVAFSNPIKITGIRCRPSSKQG